MVARECWFALDTLPTIKDASQGTQNKVTSQRTKLNNPLTSLIANSIAKHMSSLHACVELKMAHDSIVLGEADIS